MGLADDLSELREQTDERRQTCPVKRLIDDVANKEGEGQAKQTQILLDGDAYSADSLCLIFRRHGYKIARTSIRNHRMRECACVSRG